MPTQVYGAAGCIGNDRRFFIFGGGTYNFPGGSSDSIQIYNVTNDSWNFTIPMPNGDSTADQSMSCALDSSSGLMYITGGAF